MKKYILLIFIIFSRHFFIKAQDNQSKGLQKYSYLIYGDVNANSVEKGTASFIRFKGNLYLLTANHVLTGWNCNYHHKEKNYPKIMYLRAISKKDSRYVFIPINISRFINRKYDFYYWQKPDICLFKIKIPETDTINSIENLIYLQPNAISDTIISYGNSIFPARSKKEIITHDCQYGYGILAKETLEKTWVHTDLSLKDSINYILRLNKDSNLGAGFSGAPVFCKTTNGFAFCGVINGGTDNAAIIVKLQYIIDLIQHQKTLN